MASDLSSLSPGPQDDPGDDEREEGEISLEDVSSSEELHQQQKRPQQRQHPRGRNRQRFMPNQRHNRAVMNNFYRWSEHEDLARCSSCFSRKPCPYWCRTVAIARVPPIQRETHNLAKDQIPGKENRKKSVTVNPEISRAPREPRNVPRDPSTDSDADSVNLEERRRRKRRKKLAKSGGKSIRKRKKSPSDDQLILSDLESLIDSAKPAQQPQQPQTCSSDKKECCSKCHCDISSQKKTRANHHHHHHRHSRSTSPQRRSHKRRRRSRSPKKSSQDHSPEKDHQKKLDDAEDELDVDQLLRKVRRLEHLSSGNKQQGSSLKDKLSNIMIGDKKEEAQLQEKKIEEKKLDDEDDEDLELRMIALRSAVLKKHATRVKTGKVRKKKKTPTANLHVSEIESPFLDCLSQDFTPQEGDKNEVEDMELDSDLESDAELSPYSPSDPPRPQSQPVTPAPTAPVMNLNLYTPSQPTETPVKVNEQKSDDAAVTGERPYSPSDATIYDPELPGVMEKPSEPDLEVETDLDGCPLVPIAHNESFDNTSLAEPLIVPQKSAEPPGFLKELSYGSDNILITPIIKTFQPVPIIESSSVNPLMHPNFVPIKLQAPATPVLLTPSAVFEDNSKLMRRKRHRRLKRLAKKLQQVERTLMPPEFEVAEASPSDLKIVLKARKRDQLSPPRRKHSKRPRSPSSDSVSSERARRLERRNQSRAGDKENDKSDKEEIKKVTVVKKVELPVEDKEEEDEEALREMLLASLATRTKAKKALESAEKSVEVPKEIKEQTPSLFVAMKEPKPSPTVETKESAPSPTVEIRESTPSPTVEAKESILPSVADIKELTSPLNVQPPKISVVVGEKNMSGPESQDLSLKRFDKLNETKKLAIENTLHIARSKKPAHSKMDVKNLRKVMRKQKSLVVKVLPNSERFSGDLMEMEGTENISREVEANPELEKSILQFLKDARQKQERAASTTQEEPSSQKQSKQSSGVYSSITDEVDKSSIVEKPPDDKQKNETSAGAQKEETTESSLKKFASPKNIRPRRTSRRKISNNSTTSEEMDPAMLTKMCLSTNKILEDIEEAIKSLEQSSQPRETRSKTAAKNRKNNNEIKIVEVAAKKSRNVVINPIYKKRKISEQISELESSNKEFEEIDKTVENLDKPVSSIRILSKDKINEKHDWLTEVFGHYLGPEYVLGMDDLNAASRDQFVEIEPRESKILESYLDEHQLSCTPLETLYQFPDIFIDFSLGCIDDFSLATSEPVQVQETPKPPSPSPLPPPTTSMMLRSSPRKQRHCTKAIIIDRTPLDKRKKVPKDVLNMIKSWDEDGEAGKKSKKRPRIIWLDWDVMKMKKVDRIFRNLEGQRVNSRDLEWDFEGVENLENREESEVVENVEKQMCAEQQVSAMEAEVPESAKQDLNMEKQVQDVQNIEKEVPSNENSEIANSNLRAAVLVVESAEKVFSNVLNMESSNFEEKSSTVENIEKVVLDVDNSSINNVDTEKTQKDAGVSEDVDQRKAVNIVDINNTCDVSKIAFEDFKEIVNNEIINYSNLSEEEQSQILKKSEEELVTKRHTVLDNLAEMSGTLRQWEIERDIQSKLSLEVKKLREQLQLAEKKLENQKVIINNIHPKVSSTHEKIYTGRKECFRLTKICTSLGINTIGSEYGIPSTGLDLYKSRLKEVAEHTRQLQSRKLQKKLDGKSYSNKTLFDFPNPPSAPVTSKSTELDILRHKEKVLARQLELAKKKALSVNKPSLDQPKNQPNTCLPNKERTEPMPNQSNEQSESLPSQSEEKTDSEQIRSCQQMEPLPIQNKETTVSALTQNEKKSNQSKVQKSAGSEDKSSKSMKVGPSDQLVELVLNNGVIQRVNDIERVSEQSFITKEIKQEKMELEEFKPAVRPYQSVLKHLYPARTKKSDGILCPYELSGICNDVDCPYVHGSSSHC